MPNPLIDKWDQVKERLEAAEDAVGNLRIEDKDEGLLRVLLIDRAAAERNTLSLTLMTEGNRVIGPPFAYGPILVVNFTTTDGVDLQLGEEEHPWDITVFHLGSYEVASP